VASQYRGLFAMAVTPFDAGGNIDSASIARLCDFYIDRGAAGIVALGLLGEANRLTVHEALFVAGSMVRAVNGRVPVLIGVSNSVPRATEELTQAVMANGAAGVMLAPLANQRNEAQSVAYLQAIIDQIGDDVPVVVQDYPQETGSYLSPETLSRLIAANPSIRALKHEDCPGLGKISYLRSSDRPPLTRTCPILVGGGGLYLPLELARGADGAMTGFAFPEVLARVCALTADGKAEAAHDLFDRYLPYLRYEQQPRFGLAVRKYVLHRRGAIAHPALRSPAYELTSEDIVEIEQLLARVSRSETMAAGDA
jgi:4-hydroxy-tetrahydrodipicolinate synthase